MHEADDGRGESEGDPGKIENEQRQQRPFERGDAADIDHLVHFPGAERRQGHHADEDDDAHEPRRAMDQRIDRAAAGRRGPTRSAIASAWPGRDSTGMAGRAVVRLLAVHDQGLGTLRHGVHR